MEEIVTQPALELKKPNGSEPQALQVYPKTPFELMAQALQQGIPADQLKVLQEMHFKQMEWEAELEFNEALNRVQKSVTRVVPDLTNPQTSSKYASFAKLDAAVRPLYTAEGFSLSFNTDDCPRPDHVRILAYLSRGKHTRKYQIDMPVVTTGIQGKAMMTLTHASAAANSYGKRYLECDIFNIPIGPDDDGNVTLSPAVSEEFEQAKTMDAIDAIFQKHWKGADEKTKQMLITAKKTNQGRLRAKTPGVELDWGKK